MTAVLVVSAICLVRWPGSWDKPGKYWKMTSRKKTLFSSMSFVVLLLIFGAGAGANIATKTKQEETGSRASVSLPKRTSMLGIVFISTSLKGGTSMIKGALKFMQLVLPFSLQYEDANVVNSGETLMRKPVL